MVIAGSDCPPDSLRGQPRPGPAPDVWDWSDSRGSRVACVAVEIPGRGCGQLRRRGTRSVRGRCGPQDSGRMRSSLTPVGPPVSRDRVITSFPKWYTPDACLQLKEHFDRQVSTACQRRDTGTVGLQLSKVVVVGDLYVGKTSLIHRFCKNMFDRDYKATIGVDFEIERFEVAGVPYSLQIWDTAGQEKFKCIASAYYRGAQVIVSAFDLTDIQTLEHTRQWLKDALRENEAGSCLIFLVGTKKDLLSGAACEQAEAEAVQLAREMQAEYWSVSAKTGENVKAFFSRVAALAFERSVLQDLDRRNSARLQGWREAHPRPKRPSSPPAWAAVSRSLCHRPPPAPCTRVGSGFCD
ncbi:ras-related protein Rab-36 isoform X2 [Oryctolagus cuniculus]|uniref:ras-related protein Rab-36 isoform X2 n=1 Tax=Oryctolagus cuniculus TaxID=9986 RepID=UPI00048EA169|nr:ras-related protein Rab-36 isoform X2 [Oryctolagus cuniculus]